MLAEAIGAMPVRLRCPDFSDEAPLAELADVDVVIDAAGPRVHPGLNWSDYMREHVGTATRIAGSMRPGTHLVLVGSAAVYGSRRGTVEASTSPRPDTFPVEAYAWAKLAAEHAARAVCAERRVALTVLRPSIIYGPGAGGVLITLRDLARRGVRFVLSPESTRQHLLHIRLFQRVLQALITRSVPVRTSTYIVADPFLLTTADLNAVFREAGPRAVPVPVPVGFVAQAMQQWQLHLPLNAPGVMAVAAMLALDNAYDWRPCLAHAGLDEQQFGRKLFDDFMRG
jgi:nucleoside-diphosphate-sugar epimerase